MEESEKKAPPACTHCQNGMLCARKIPLFSALPENARNSLAAHSIHTVRAKGSFLFQVGEKAESILLIKKGRIKLCKYDADGNEYIFDIIHDGDAIWEPLFPDNAAFTFSAVCLSAVELCEIKKSDFIHLIANRPDVAMSLIALLSTRLKDANEKVLLLSIRDPKVRLAGFLLDRDERCVGPEIKLKLSDIAASIGLRPETVSRNLSQFEAAHLINRLGQGKLRVIDRSGLKKIYHAGGAED